MTMLGLILIVSMLVWIMFKSQSNTSHYRKLSKEFIEGIQDKINWNNILINQKLSMNSIEIEKKIEALDK